MFKTSLPTWEHCSLSDLFLECSRLQLSVCILVFRWEESVKSSWNWFLWQTPVPYQCGCPFCFCFCFWCRDDSSLLLLFHCLPHCNSYLTCLVIPEFPKRSHWACDSTVSAWLVRCEDASVVIWRLTKWDSGCAGSLPVKWGSTACSAGGRTRHVWRNTAWDPCNFASRKLQSFLGF